MADENSVQQARLAFRALCEMMEEENWHYEKEEENFRIYCGAQGDDLPMRIRVDVDPERLLVILISDIPFVVPEDHRAALAVAVSAANYGLVDGSFDYDFLGGNILFRMTSSFRESLIGKNMFQYMLYCSCMTIDKYNDKFLKVAQSDMSTEEIVDFME